MIHRRTTGLAVALCLVLAGELAHAGTMAHATIACQKRSDLEKFGNPTDEASFGSLLMAKMLSRECVNLRRGQAVDVEVGMFVDVVRVRPEGLDSSYWVLRSAVQE